MAGAWGTRCRWAAETLLAIEQVQLGAVRQSSCRRGGFYIGRAVYSRLTFLARRKAPLLAETLRARGDSALRPRASNLTII